ncbi:MAG TPA: DUF3011 domain-containing protein, partial [Vicinamibacterales bacterium]|nr:DUF3011 domain-containing protein [Vicinamibacterales bacterium]
MLELANRNLSRHMTSLAFLAAVVLLPSAVGAQTTAGPALVTCESTPGARQTCAADTSKGVTIAQVIGTAPCEFGATWGFDKSIWVRDGCRAEFAVPGGTTAQQEWGTYAPGAGFKLANTQYGDLNFRIMTYARYLNQRGLEERYTDSFGQERRVQQRQDIQLNKVTLNFMGWLMSPKFRYLAYVWTQNTGQGQPAQVVVAGNLTYTFSPHVIFGVGINSLPGTRTTNGSFPFWHSVDSRLIADTYFTPSYTTGLFARGDIVKGLTYQAMLGNNLSQLGVDAGQLGNDLSAVSGELVWMPTTGEYGPGNNRFGDFDGHDKVATRVALHFTRSDEDRQSQPDTEAIENAQIR